MDKLDFTLESFKNIQELIRFIDQKAGAVLVITGLIFSGFIGFFKGLEFNLEFYKSPMHIIVLLSGIATLFSMTYVIHLTINKILKPRLSTGFSEKYRSIFYFDHLAIMTNDQIRDGHKKLNDIKMQEEIENQIFEISRILKKKIKYLNDAFKFLFVSTISVITFIIASNMI